jgi:hypothetical protein
MTAQPACIGGALNAGAAMAVLELPAGVLP